MTALWITLLVGAGTTAILFMAVWKNRIDMTELGTISQSWLAEQRANDRHYSER